MGLIDEIKNLKITIETPIIHSTLPELGYDDEFIKTQFLCDEITDEEELKELIKEDILEFIYDFIEPQIHIDGHISI